MNASWFGVPAGAAAGAIAAVVTLVLSGMRPWRSRPARPGPVVAGQLREPEPAPWQGPDRYELAFAQINFLAGLAARWLPRSPRAERRPDLDLPGMALFAGALVALLLFLVRPSAAHWYLPVLAGAAVMVAAGAGFAVREFRAAEPFLDLRVLVEDRALLRTYCRAVLAYSVSYAFLYGYTQWLEDGRGLSATMAGMVQLPVFATAILVSGLTGRSPRVRGKLIGGAVAQLAACGLMAVVEPSTAVWALIAVALVAGIPQGLNGLALQNSVYHQADPERIGSSAGLLRTSTYLGALVASAAQGVLIYGSGQILHSPKKGCYGHRPGTRLNNMTSSPVVIYAGSDCAGPPMRTVNPRHGAVVRYGSFQVLR